MSELEEPVIRNGFFTIVKRIKLKGFIDAWSTEVFSFFNTEEREKCFAYLDGARHKEIKKGSKSKFERIIIERAPSLFCDGINWDRLDESREEND